MPAIAIIIPCLNEAEHLPATLGALQGALADPAVDVILVDAGSDDGSVELAKNLGCRVIAGKRRQRAHQLNLGAAEAAGDAQAMLLFLHADTLIEAAALEQLQQTIRDPQIVGGGFCRRFDSPSLYLRWSSWMGDLRGRLWNIFYGDQAMFVRRSAFDELGGFDESLDVAEDLDFSLRLRELGRVVALRPAVISSARRFAAIGPRKQIRRDREFVKRWMRERGWRNWRRGRGRGR